MLFEAGFCCATLTGWTSEVIQDDLESLANLLTLDSQVLGFYPTPKNFSFKYSLQPEEIIIHFMKQRQEPGCTDQERRQSLCPHLPDSRQENLLSKGDRRGRLVWMQMVGLFPLTTARMEEESWSLQSPTGNQQPGTGGRSKVLRGEGSVATAQVEPLRASHQARHSEALWGWLC